MMLFLFLLLVNCLKNAPSGTGVVFAAMFWMFAQITDFSDTAGKQASKRANVSFYVTVYRQKHPVFCNRGLCSEDKTDLSSFLLPVFPRERLQTVCAEKQMAEEQRRVIKTNSCCLSFIHVCVGDPGVSRAAMLR